MKTLKRYLIILACLVLFLQGCGATDDLSGYGVYEDESEIHRPTLTPKDGSDTASEPSSQGSSTSTVTQPQATPEPEEQTEPEQPEQTIDEDGYHYLQLSADEQKVYAEVYRSIVDRSEVQLSTMDSALIEKAFACVMNDHPEIFYASGYVYTTHSRNDVPVSMSVTAKYDYDEAQTAQLQTSINNEVARILAMAPKSGTDYDKIKYVFDTLVKNTSYRLNSKDNQNIASVFLYHESVCQGYAKATQYLLNELGIEATLVVGSANGESHAWNLVKADGAWYYLDTTWGDADYQSVSESGTQNVWPICYDYFMIDSTALTRTHTPTKTVPLPNCTAKDCNYFIHEDLYLTGLDTDKIAKIFEDGYANHDEVVQFKCANDAVYSQVKSYLLDEQHVFDYYQESGSITYTAYDNTDAFCFWLFK